MQIDIVSLQGIARDKEIAIFACGWSLMGFDYESFRSIFPGITIGVNRIIRAFDPSYWFTSEQKIEFIDMARLVKPQTTAIVRKGFLAEFFEERPEVTFAAYDVEEDWTVQDYDTHSFPRGRFFTRATVTLGALEFARFLGASTIYLFGCDMAFAPQTKQYYFDPSIKPERVNERPDMVNGHLMNHNLERMKKWLDNWYERYGKMVKAINLSPTRNLKFPAMSYEEFRNAHSACR